MEKTELTEKRIEQKREIKKSSTTGTTAVRIEKKTSSNAATTLSSIKSRAPGTKPKGKIAIILIRGVVRARENIIATLFALRLRKKNSCVVLEDTPSNRASAMKCKDYAAFGDINEETYKLLVEKRGKKGADGKLKQFFLLHPPRGGFERKGIKTPFSNGGALGNRGEKINDLIKKML
ncbi:uL30 family ribosomal protein [Candidatus Woesearchaeota archaeon]|nr:uL30 family ribosomal protein [Candidatus Woesearchaeota archaeon]